MTVHLHRLSMATATIIMSSNKVPQSSDVPVAGTGVEGVSPLVQLLLSREGNDDEVGCREVSVVAAEAATGVVPQQGDVVAISYCVRR